MARRALSNTRLLTARPQSTLSARQIEDVAGTEVKFPLYAYLRDIQQEQRTRLDAFEQEQKTRLDAFGNDLAGVKKEMTDLKMEVTRLPLILLGGNVALATLARLTGFFESGKQGQKPNL